MIFNLPSYHDLNLLGDNTTVWDDHPHFVFMDEGFDRLYSHLSGAVKDITLSEETKKLTLKIFENAVPLALIGAFGVIAWKNRGVAHSKEAADFVKCIFENAVMSGYGNS